QLYTLSLHDALPIFMMDAVTDQHSDRALSPRLVFLADVDGSADAFVLALVGSAGDGLRTIFQHCQDYAGRAGLLDYIRANTISTAANYVNTIGRTVSQVRQEAQLHDAIEGFLDRTRNEWKGVDPR